MVPASDAPCRHRKPTGGLYSSNTPDHGAFRTALVLSRSDSQKNMAGSEPAFSGRLPDPDLPDDPVLSRPRMAAGFHRVLHPALEFGTGTVLPLPARAPYGGRISRRPGKGSRRWRLPGCRDGAQTIWRALPAPGSGPPPWAPAPGYGSGIGAPRF